MMFAHPGEAEELKDARLACTHPEAYEAKMKAREDGGLIKDFVGLLKSLFAKKAK
jgi:hypothetical protein